MQFILRETLNFEFHSSGNFSFSSYYMLVLLWLFITHLLLGSISLFLFHHLSQILITTYPAASNSSHFCLLSVSYPSVICSQPSQNNLQSLCAAFHLLAPLRFPTLAVGNGSRLHQTWAKLCCSRICYAWPTVLLCLAHLTGLGSLQQPHLEIPITVILLLLLHLTTIKLRASHWAHSQLPLA